MTFFPSSSSSRVRAFSLVEVLMALGVVSTVLLAMVAVVPIGTATMGDSLDDSVMAMIAREVVADLNRNGSAEPDWQHFDLSGTRVKDEQGERHFTVWIERGGPSQLPGSDDLLAGSQHSQNCVVYVGASGEANKEFFRDASHHSQILRIVVIAPSSHREGAES